MNLVPHPSFVFSGEFPRTHLRRKPVPRLPAFPSPL
jgi:hypothetical protein